MQSHQNHNVKENLPHAGEIFVTQYQYPVTLFLMYYFSDHQLTAFLFIKIIRFLLRQRFPLNYFWYALQVLISCFSGHTFQN